MGPTLFFHSDLFTTEKVSAPRSFPKEGFPHEPDKAAAVGADANTLMDGKWGDCAQTDMVGWCYLYRYV